MPTPNLTSACEYASGNASNPSSAKYLRYFIANLLSFPFRFASGEMPDPEVLQFLLSEAPTQLDLAGREKVVWLISVILREINHLRDKSLISLGA